MNFLSLYGGEDLSFTLSYFPSIHVILHLAFIRPAYNFTSLSLYVKSKNPLTKSQALHRTDCNETCYTRLFFIGYSRRSQRNCSDQFNRIRDP